MNRRLCIGVVVKLMGSNANDTQIGVATTYRPTYK